MKKIQTFIYVLLMGVFFTACQEDDFGGSAQGGIRIALADGTAGVDVTTRSTPSELFDGFKEKFKFQIKGDNYDQTHNWTDDVISLAAGVYDITATCGTEQADGVVEFDKPCYTGTKEGQKVNAGETATTVEIPCEVTNALVSIKFAEGYESYAEEAYAMIAVGSGTATNWAELSESAYFKAGSSLSKLVLYRDGSESLNADILAEAKKSSDFPATFKAGDHLIITLTVGKANGNVAIKVSKVELKKVPIKETIPMEWLPKPKMAVEGFDATTKMLSMYESETPTAKFNFNLSSGLQELKFTLDFKDEEYKSLNKAYTLSELSQEDRTALTNAGVVLPAIGDKSKVSLDFSGLAAKLTGSTDGNALDNVITLTEVKANNRVLEGGEQTYTIQTHAPEFGIKVYPGNTWTKQFTANTEITKGNAEVIRKGMTFEYSTNGSDWTSSDSIVTGLTPGTPYQVRAKFGKHVTEVASVTTYQAMDIPNSTLDGGYTTTNPKRNNPLYTFNGGWIDTRNELTCHGDGANAFYVSKSSTLPINDNGSTVAHMMVIGWGAGNTCDFGEKRNSVINNISSGLVCVGDYDASSDIINAKAAYIRPSSLTFTYKASPYNGDEYLIEATFLNITDGVETIIGEGKLQSGTSVGNYTTQLLDIAYDESVKELPISHVRVLFKAGTKEDRDHLENDFRDASIWDGYSNAYIIGSQFWLDSFHFNYDK